LWYKDLKLALEVANELGLTLPATSMAQELIESDNAEEDRK
jgi:3-hydroxyisobutyrate dehydrogenase-like beta-hydroxyacid dehydrogenase